MRPQNICVNFTSTTTRFTYTVSALLRYYKLTLFEQASLENVCFGHDTFSRSRATEEYMRKFGPLKISK